MSPKKGIESSLLSHYEAGGLFLHWKQEGDYFWLLDFWRGDQIAEVETEEPRKRAANEHWFWKHEFLQGKTVDSNAIATSGG